MKDRFEILTNRHEQQRRNKIWIKKNIFNMIEYKAERKKTATPKLNQIN